MEFCVYQMGDLLAFTDIYSCLASLCIVVTRLLSEISSIKQAKEQQAAEARRQATPVVGDMRPLADALPELSQLIAPAATAHTARRKSRKNKV